MAAVYFISADDEFIANNRAKEIFDELSADAVDEMSKEIVQGACAKFDDVKKVYYDLFESAGTLSLFGGKKTVWLKGANFFGDGRVSQSSSAGEMLEKIGSFLSKLDEKSVNVIISASPIDRRKKFFKDLKEYAKWEDFQAGDAIQDCVGFLKDEARKLGVSFGYGAAESIAGLVGGSPRMAVEELRKLATYSNFSGEITQETVFNMVPMFGDVDFNGISEAFYAGDLDAALAALKRYYFADKNASARPVISSIQRQNSILIQIRALMDCGDVSSSGNILSKAALSTLAERYADLYPDISYKTNFNVFSQHPWLVGSKLVPIAARLSLKILLDWQEYAAAAFEAIIARPSQEESIMCDLFVRCLAK